MLANPKCDGRAPIGAAILRKSSSDARHLRMSSKDVTNDTSETCSLNTVVGDEQGRNGVPVSDEATKRASHVETPGISTTLVTSDGKKFHVPNVLLAMASPFFADMLRPKRRSSIPSVVTLSGVDAATLNMILRYLYPITPKPSVNNVEEAASLVQVARRYQFVAVENSILADVTILLAAEPNPLRAWAGAIACGADVARKAAMIRFLQVEDEDFDSVKRQAHSVLMHATAQQLYDLEMWRTAAIEQAKQAIRTAKVENVYPGQQTAFEDQMAFYIAKVNPFLHFDIFVSILVRVSNQPRSSNVQWMLGPEGRQKIMKTIRSEVQTVLEIFQCELRAMQAYSAHSMILNQSTHAIPERRGSCRFQPGTINNEILI